MASLSELRAAMEPWCARDDRLGWASYLGSFAVYFGTLALALFAGHEMGGDDTHGACPRRLRGAGDLSHQADIACAIDQPPAFLRDGLPEIAGGLRIGGAVAGT